MTDDLVAFIQARIDEDVARAETVHDMGCGEIRYDGPCTCGWPARVLRGVAAERLILAAHSHEVFQPREGCPDTVGCGTCHVEDASLYAGGWCDTMRAAGSEWSTHEDYRPEWTP